jgi:hypothetical protein
MSIAEYPTYPLPQGFHEKSNIVEVELSDLKVDRSYQRDPSQKLVDSIAENWDEVASELILVSDRGQRDDEQQSGLFVINGQHRTIAARRLGHMSIWARTIDMSDLDDPALVEAALRLKTNVRLGDRPLERFKAQLRAGNEESHAIVKLLARYDTQINEVVNPEMGINSVTGIEILFRHDQGGLLAEILETVKAAYGKIGGKTATIDLMKGIGWFIVTHSDETDRGRLISKLSDTGPAALDRRARVHMSVMGGTLWQNYYRAIVDFYNEKLIQKNKLEWRLRGATSWAARSSEKSQRAKTPS